MSEQRKTEFVIQQGVATAVSGELTFATPPGDKPEEFQSFESLTRKLTQVSKSELDQKRQTT